MAEKLSTANPNPKIQPKTKDRDTKYVRYDWDAIAQEYIQGYFILDPETGIRKHVYPDYEDLHNKYGPSMDRLYRKGGEEKWSLKRQVFKAKIKEHLTDRQISTFLSESAQHDALTLDKVRKLHKLLDYSLSKYNYILNSEYKVEYDPEMDVSLKDLQTLTSILTSTHNLVRSVVGEPVSVKETSSLNAEVAMLNPAADASQSKARKDKIKDLQEKLKNNNKTKQKLLPVRNEDEEVTE